MLCLVLFGEGLWLFIKLELFIGLFRFGVDLDVLVYFDSVVLFFEMECNSLGLLGMIGMVIGIVVDRGCCLFIIEL